MVQKQEESSAETPPRVILFTGHRVDAPGRMQPRFPPNVEKRARDMVKNAIAHEQLKASRNPLLGISGCASGGDILFHEVCDELNVPTKIFLALPKHDYVQASVADGGPRWVERFTHLVERKETQTFSDSTELPPWLRTKKEYNIWQQSNLWMLHHALHLSNNDLILLALWNGQSGDGAGGTADMVEQAKARGATFIHLDARKLLE